MIKSKSAISATNIGGSATSGGGHNSPRPADNDDRGGRSEMEFTSGSVEETQAFGEQLGKLLQPGDVVALSGELGSGKTTFIQGIARGLGRDPETIKSPTFVLMREYPHGPPAPRLDPHQSRGGRPSPEPGRATLTRAGAGDEVPLVHIDGYRLEGAPTIAALDLEWFFDPQKITLIEWAERFSGLLPDEYLQGSLEHVSTNRRRIHLVGNGVHGQEIVSRLQNSAAPKTTGSTSQPANPSALSLGILAEESRADARDRLTEPDASRD